MNNRDKKCCMIQCKISAEAAEKIDAAIAFLMTFWLYNNYEQ